MMALMLRNVIYLFVVCLIAALFDRCCAASCAFAFLSYGGGVPPKIARSSRYPFANFLEISCDRFLAIGKNIL
jgi:hypothetical protein